MRAIVEAIGAGQLAAQACLVISNNRSAPALDFAEAHGIPALRIATQTDPEGADRRLCAALEAAGVDWVILSGYLRQLGPITLGRYRNRVFNIHPGPLPEFGGHGMYGHAVHEAVAAAGVDSAVTIHLVDEVYDRGPVLSARRVPAIAGETAQALEARVTALEPEVFVHTLQAILAGEISLPD